MAGLKIRTPTIHRRGDVMDLVVDNQSPLAAIEQLPVSIHSCRPVGGDRDRPDVFRPAVVLADLVRVERRACEEFFAPLAGQFPPRY